MNITNSTQTNATNSTNITNATTNSTPTPTPTPATPSLIFPYSENYYEPPNSDAAIMSLPYFLVNIGIPWMITILLIIINLIVCLCVKRRISYAKKNAGNSDRIPFQQVNSDIPMLNNMNSPIISHPSQTNLKKDKDVNKSLLYETNSNSMMNRNSLLENKSYPNPVNFNNNGASDEFPKKKGTPEKSNINNLNINHNPGIPLISHQPALPSKAPKATNVFTKENDPLMFPHEKDPNYGSVFNIKKNITEENLGTNFGEGNSNINSPNLGGNSKQIAFAPYQKSQYPIRLPPINQKKGTIQNSLMIDPFSNKS